MGDRPMEKDLIGRERCPQASQEALREAQDKYKYQCIKSRENAVERLQRASTREEEENE